MKTVPGDVVAERLKELPDIQPANDAWKRVLARQARAGRHIVWPATGVAVAAALAAAVFLTGPLQDGPARRGTLDMLPADTQVVPDALVVASENPDLRALQRRSRQIEQMLAGLPPRAQIVRADTEGAIGELEDRIAAVDYELNRAALKRATEGASSQDRAMQRGLFVVDSRRASGGRTIAAPTVDTRSQNTQDLWRKRVELMDQLLQVRYVEAGALSF